MTRGVIVMAACVLALGACSGGSPGGPAASAVEEGRVRASGTEPFWGVDVSPEGGLVFTEAATDGELRAAYVKPVRKGEAIEYATPQMTLTLRPGPCSDGMSDIDYPLTASLVAGARRLEGCAFRPWRDDVRAFIPAIDACMAKAPVRMPVTHVAQDGKSQRVRLTASGPEERYDCVYENGIAKLARATRELPGDRQVMFVRAPGEDPGGACAASTPVTNEKGEMLGWIVPNEPC
jgi:uncharacterized membrane protein